LPIERVPATPLFAGADRFGSLLSGYMMAPRSILPTGLVLDQSYEIRRVLGAGGFGITCEAFDKGLNRAVAVKEYYPAEIGRRVGQTSIRPASDKDEELSINSGRALSARPVPCRSLSTQQSSAYFACSRPTAPPTW
jgi:serine/threonine protein kinase